jgi:hypothetical protein
MLQVHLRPSDGESPKAEAPAVYLASTCLNLCRKFLKCVGNVLEMCPLKLILASWKGLGMQWFVYECVLAYYVSIKFLKFPT